MPTASHPLVASYLRRRTSWSALYADYACATLNRWCDFLAGRGVDLCAAGGDDCAEYLEARAETVGSTTLHKDYQHLRWLYRWLVAEEEWVDPRGRERRFGPMTGIDPPTVADPAPERVGYVTERDFELLLRSFGKRAIVDCRDAAIVSLLYRTGLRRSEVCRLERDRLDLRHGTIEVYTKRKRWNKVPLAVETIEWVERYLRRRDVDGGDDCAALFVTTTSRGFRHPRPRPLRPDAVSGMLDRRGARVGVDVAAHEFRRASTANDKRAGMSDSAVCNIKDWADNRMMARYTRAQANDLAIAEFRATDPTAPTRRRSRLG